jgi:hypothetical protein
VPAALLGRTFTAPRGVTTLDVNVDAVGVPGDHAVLPRQPFGAGGEAEGIMSVTPRWSRRPRCGLSKCERFRSCRGEREAGGFCEA